MNIDQAREILAPRAWVDPDSYAGFSPVGDYVVIAQNRDSDAVTRSNYIRVREELGCVPYDEGRSDEPSADRPAVYDWRAGHWLCGWVEYGMLRADAPDEKIIEAAEIVAALSDYPVFDDDHLSELEWTEAMEYWSVSSIRARAEMIKDSGCGASIFAARRNEPPQDDDGSLFEYLRS